MKKVSVIIMLMSATLSLGMDKNPDLELVKKITDKLVESKYPDNLIETYYKNKQRKSESNHKASKFSKSLINSGINIFVEKMILKVEKTPNKRLKTIKKISNHIFFNIAPKMIQEKKEDLNSRLSMESDYKNRKKIFATIFSKKIESFRQKLKIFNSDEIKFFSSFNKEKIQKLKILEKANQFTDKEKTFIDKHFIMNLKYINCHNLSISTEKGITTEK